MGSHNLIDKGKFFIIKNNLERSCSMAKNKVEEIDEDTQKGKFLTFMIGNEGYGISIEFIREIIGILPITEVPELPEYTKGIINLRGKIIPVMDVRLRFKKEFRPYNERTCIIVVDINDNSVGLIVDSVAEVTNIPEEDIVSPPTLNTGFSNKYIKAIGKIGNEVKLLLDCEKVISQDDMETLKSMAGEISHGKN